MSKSVHIGSRSSTCSYDIYQYMKPEIVYIPLQSKSGLKYDCLVKDGDYVYKGQEIAVNSEYDFPIHSSVSGIVKIPCMKMTSLGKSTECIGIFNDFKEKYRRNKMTSKDLSNYKREDFIDDLRINGISGLSSDFPTYVKFKGDNLKYLIVNGSECFPYVSCDKTLMYNYAELLLETIDNIMTIMKIKKAVVVLLETDRGSLDEFNKYIHTYPNISISLIKDRYPNGWERNVIYDTFSISYHEYPSERGIILCNVATIYAIYEMLKYNRVTTSRIVTISGPGVKKKMNVMVKIGSLASDVISSVNGYKKIKNPLFVVGDLMRGSSFPMDEVVITKDVNAIFVIPDNFEKSSPCIKCGKCIDICPSNILPVIIMENIDRVDRLARLDTTKCISCGLCSFVCPAKIEVLEYVKRAREKVSQR